MSRVYECASMILVYLGPAFPSDADAIDLMSKMSKALPAAFLATDDKAVQPPYFEPTDHGLPPFIDHIWLDFIHFFDRPCFGRRWIIQSVTQCQNFH